MTEGLYVGGGRIRNYLISDCLFVSVFLCHQERETVTVSAWNPFIFKQPVSSQVDTPHFIFPVSSISLRLSTSINKHTHWDYVQFVYISTITYVAQTADMTDCLLTTPVPPSCRHPHYLLECIHKMKPSPNRLAHTLHELKHTSGNMSNAGCAEAKLTSGYCWC